MDEALEKNGLKIKAPLQKAIIDALSERDETADVVKDDKGNKMPDADLRDYENVPLGENIDAYMKREVLPYVPDAWVDETKTKDRLRDQFQPLLLRIQTTETCGGHSEGLGED